MLRYKFLLLVILLATSGCNSQYSVRESQILEGIPLEQRLHDDGIISSPSKQDIEQAIKFGESSKDSDALMYAYLVKGPSDTWTKSVIYVKVSTPLSLIASHSREQAREYKDVDSMLIQYLANLDVVKLSISQQYNNNFIAYPVKREMILLRDGRRVDTNPSIKSYDGKNPFNSESEKLIANTASDSLAAMYSQLPASGLKMTQEQLEGLESTYRSMGYSEDQIKTYRDAIAYATGTTTNHTNPQSLVISETDNIYTISEISLPGKYEIVFRTPPSNNMFAKGDQEIRFPISFRNFK